MKVIIERDKTLSKPLKRPFWVVTIGNYSGDMFYNSLSEQPLVIQDQMLKRNMNNYLTIKAYKSEKQYQKHIRKNQEKRNMIYNVLMGILSVFLFIFYL